MKISWLLPLALSWVAEGARKPTPPPKATAAKGDLTDECPETNGFFADGFQCDKYYECRDGVIEEKLCPDGMVFNDYSPQVEKCDLPFNIDCSERPELQTPKPSAHCRRQNGYFSHEDSSVCDKFYFCVDGKYNMITCPSGLVYNEKTGICTWPDEAKKKGCSSEGAAVRQKRLTFWPKKEQEEASSVELSDKEKKEDKSNEEGDEYSDYDDIGSNDKHKEYNDEGTYPDDRDYGISSLYDKNSDYESSGAYRKNKDYETSGLYENKNKHYEGVGPYHTNKQYGGAGPYLKKKDYDEEEESKFSDEFSINSEYPDFDIDFDTFGTSAEDGDFYDHKSIQRRKDEQLDRYISEYVAQLNKDPVKAAGPMGLSYYEKIAEASVGKNVKAKPSADTACSGNVDMTQAQQHPRYPDPEDCQFFYVCINGEIPRRNGCKLGQVFNEGTGSCDWPRNVPECLDWYKGILTDEELYALEHPKPRTRSNSTSSSSPRRKQQVRIQ